VSSLQGAKQHVVCFKNHEVASTKCSRVRRKQIVLNQISNNNIENLPWQDSALYSNFHVLLSHRRSSTVSLFKGGSLRCWRFSRSEHGSGEAAGGLELATWEISMPQSPRRFAAHSLARSCVTGRNFCRPSYLTNLRICHLLLARNTKVDVTHVSSRVE